MAFWKRISIVHFQHQRARKSPVKMRGGITTGGRCRSLLPEEKRSGREAAREAPHRHVGPDGGCPEIRRRTGQTNGLRTDGGRKRRTAIDGELRRTWDWRWLANLMLNPDAVTSSSPSRVLGLDRNWTRAGAGTMWRGSVAPWLAPRRYRSRDHFIRRITSRFHPLLSSPFRSPIASPQHFGEQPFLKTSCPSITPSLCLTRAHFCPSSPILSLNSTPPAPSIPSPPKHTELSTRSPREP